MIRQSSQPSPIKRPHLTLRSGTVPSGSTLTVCFFPLAHLTCTLMVAAILCFALAWPAWWAGRWWAHVRGSMLTTSEEEDEEMHLKQHKAGGEVAARPPPPRFLSTSH